MTGALLRGRSHDWPLAGHVLGRHGVPTGGVQVHWAGRVGAEGDVGEAWRASRVLERSLREGAEGGRDAKSSLVSMWGALERVTPSEWGARSGEDLSLLLVAADEQGVTVSAVGLGRIDALGDGDLLRVLPWIDGDHPLLGPPGLPDRRPGALTIRSAPAWLVGEVWGEEGASPEGDLASTLLPRCGIHP